MAKQHKIAILGLEHWYWAYPIAGAVSAMKDAELTYVIGEDEEQTQKTADLMRAKHWGTDYRIALEDPEVDIVVIMPTTNRHEELAIAAANAKKHILISKPLARTLAGADRIIQAVRENGVIMTGIGAGPNPTDPVMQLVSKGVIGRPYTATSSCRARTPLKAPGCTDVGWFKDASKASGGAFVDHAIYAATRLQMIFDSKVESVYARMGKMVHKDWDVEDYGIAILTYENGAIATIESTFGATEYTVNNFLLTGTEGEIQADDDTLKITGSKEPYKVPQITRTLPRNPVYLTLEDYANPFNTQADAGTAMIKELIDVIDNGAVSLNTPENARIGLEICLASYLSLKTGTAVKLPLTEDVDVPAILAEVL